MIDLRTRDSIILKALLRTYAPQAEVWAYGSRTSGENHARSDLDLVLRNTVALDAPQSSLALLRDAIEESDIPFMIDVHDWALLSENFRRQIETRHVVLIPAALAPTTGSPRCGDRDV
ncbi:MAG: nucleotidyltransferase domain-containing protein [Hyphomicrobiales bacterium]|nr:MAG: nucleotidyltransferase domain-containing protein [Hyphomicrobiales bacterium]